MTTARDRSPPNASRLMLPMPVTMPSAGVLRIRSSSSRRRRCAAYPSAPYSTKLPASQRSAMFSRAVRRPRACRLATASGRAASASSASRARSSSRSARTRSAPARGAMSSPVGSADAAGRTVASTDPASTTSPTSWRNDSTTPSLVEWTSCSIFIDSTTATSAPRRTLAPTSTASATTLPASGETIFTDAMFAASAGANRIAVTHDRQPVERNSRAAPRDHVGHHPRRAGGHRPAERAMAGGEEEVADRRRTDHRRAVGGHRPEAAPELGAVDVAAVGEQIVDDMHQRFAARVVQAQGVAGELGGAAGANAVAEPRHRDLVRLVHHRRLGRADGVADRHGDRIALDRVDGDAHADRREQQRRIAAERDQVGVGSDDAAVGGDAADAIAAAADRADRRLEAEVDAALLRQLGEALGEAMTVAGLVAGQE